MSELDKEPTTADIKALAITIMTNMRIAENSLENSVNELKELGFFELGIPIELCTIEEEGVIKRLFLDHTGTLKSGIIGDAIDDPISFIKAAIDFDVKECKRSLYEFLKKYVPISEKKKNESIDTVTSVVDSSPTTTTKNTKVTKKPKLLLSGETSSKKASKK